MVFLARKKMAREDDYAPRKITDKRWEVLKFSGHHGRYLTTYKVIKGDAGWYCTCTAGHNCKHIKLVMNEMNPKRSLF
jgi:hypothetical protein